MTCTCWRVYNHTNNRTTVHNNDIWQSTCIWLVFKSCTMRDQRYRVGQVHKGQGLKSWKECSMYMHVCTCAWLKLFIMSENQGTWTNHALINFYWSKRWHLSQQHTCKYIAVIRESPWESDLHKPKHLGGDCLQRFSSEELLWWIHGQVESWDARVSCGEVDLVCRANSDAGLWLVGPGVCQHGGEEVQKLICRDRIRVELCRSQSIFELLVLQFSLSGCQFTKSITYPLACTPWAKTQLHMIISGIWSTIT